jgi:uncharacterized protein with GYD domain
MATYIRLIRFSDQAMEDLNHMRDRVAAAKKAYRRRRR